MTLLVGIAQFISNLRKRKRLPFVSSPLTVNKYPSAGTHDCCEFTGILGDVSAVVVVEGDSDRAVLETLAERLGRDLEAEAVPIVTMVGASSR